MLIEIKSAGMQWLVRASGQEVTEILVPDRETAERIALALTLRRETGDV